MIIVSMAEGYALVFSHRQDLQDTVRYLDTILERFDSSEGLPPIVCLRSMPNPTVDHMKDILATMKHGRLPKQVEILSRLQADADPGDPAGDSSEA